MQDNRIIQLEDTVEKLRSDIRILASKNTSMANENNILSSPDSNMTLPNPVPSQRIINNYYLPAIADRLQQIRQHTGGRVPLTQINLDALYEDINH